MFTVENAIIEQNFRFTLVLSTQKMIPSFKNICKSYLVFIIKLTI